ncbi:MAG: PP2C family serine/threonine-protein phosphatase [Planctomycetota bacterium]
MQPLEPHLVCCPHCGHASRDAEFCDACNCEIGELSSPQQAAPTQIDLGDGQVVDCSFLQQGWPDLEQSEPFEVTWQKPHRGRLHAFSPQHWASVREAVEERSRTQLRALPPIRIIPAEAGAVVLVEYCEGTNPLSELNSAASSAGTGPVLHEIQCRVQLYGQAMAELHGQGLVWLNFDPQAVEVVQGEARITNLDTVLFRRGECPSRLRVSPRYSPPEVCRFQGGRIGPASDVFHLAMYTYYAVAGLLPEGFSGRGLEAFGFRIPPLRIYVPHLPAGIWPVLARGLQSDPLLRQATIDEFLAELDAAIRAISPALWVDRSPPGSGKNRLISPRNRRRQNRWCPEIGQLTIAGAAKSALGAVNQDSVVVETVTHESRRWQVMIVADGVSVSRIGRGEIASQTACRGLLEFVQQAVATTPGPHDWASILEQACLQASQQILQVAQPELAGLRNVADNEVMSTTLVMGILDGNVLHLANVGDSRAYRISSNGIAEQLTVDGDVGTSMLAEGVPPEQVQELGVSAKSLRYCLGACSQEADGRLVCNPVRCRPTYSRWELGPDETVVLCTDGLVEEGVFLEPEELAASVTAGVSSTAQQLAERLVCEADHRQRVPSPNELGGFGDNISCVILRVTEARQTRMKPGTVKNETY